MVQNLLIQYKKVYKLLIYDRVVLIKLSLDFVCMTIVILSPKFKYLSSYVMIGEMWREMLQSFKNIAMERRAKTCRPVADLLPTCCRLAGVPASKRSQTETRGRAGLTKPGFGTLPTLLIRLWVFPRVLPSSTSARSTTNEGQVPGG